ncbi:DUF1992 domain-containing protein [Fodinibacter luteus]|uniref:DUF1992 domain-containing protein n=1 Tax=Fodinibacter luteus TaxID=552064 RepID=A0ABP8JVB0_9MICO
MDVEDERPRWESPVERAIREAQERGEFDDLPGAGKPLTDLGDPDDPLWWVRRKAAAEGLDLSLALPPALQLRKEAASYPEALADLRSEAAVREVLEDFNHRVRRARLRPPDPGMPQILAPTVDVDAMVARWRHLRAASQPPKVDPPVTTGEARPRRPWWRPRR